jgi:hypothetical protein
MQRASMHYGCCDAHELSTHGHCGAQHLHSGVVPAIPPRSKLPRASRDRRAGDPLGPGPSAWFCTSRGAGRVDSGIEAKNVPHLPLKPRRRGSEVGI